MACDEPLFLLLSHLLSSGACFESTPILFGASFVGRGGREEMLWGFRAMRFEGHSSPALFPLLAFHWAVFTRVLPETSFFAALAALSSGRMRLERSKSLVGVRSSSSTAVSQPWDLAPPQGQTEAPALPLGWCCCQKLSGSKRGMKTPLGRGWEHPEWIWGWNSTVSGRNSAAEGLNSKAQVTTCFLSVISAVKS